MRLKGSLESSNQSLLEVYRLQRRRLAEDFGIEENLLAGSYAYRQVLELVQNAADAILEAEEGGQAGAGEGRIAVLLRGSRLYVANTGAPLDEQGLEALLGSHSSPKRGNQIGRFGLGFKSLLRFGGRIDVFGRTHGDLRFDPVRCRDMLIREFCAENAPGLRMAWPLEGGERGADENLSGLEWAETVVRAEINAEGLTEHVRQEIREFPAEFLLFFPAAAQLLLDDGSSEPREVRVDARSGVLVESGETFRWRVVTQQVAISDPRAKKDATHIHDRPSVPISWAVPLDGGREEAGRFWAFFPTRTPTHLPGILNAPWKLNDDRTHVIPGEWNTALMTEAAQMIARCLPGLTSMEDPGRLLDWFPRQIGRKDEEAAPLVEALWAELETAPVIADALGALRRTRELGRPPLDEPSLTRAWTAIADDASRASQVHASCLEGQRARRLEALAERLSKVEEASGMPALGRWTSAEWFDRIASCEVSRAIEVLDLVEEYSKRRPQSEWTAERLALRVVPAAGETLTTPERAILAPEGLEVPGKSPVAAVLYDREDARRVLTVVLGVRELDDTFWKSLLSDRLESARRQRFSSAAAWEELWKVMRLAPERVRGPFLEEHRAGIRVRRRDEVWVQPTEALFEGSFVGAGDTPRNRRACIDTEFHGEDHASLLILGVAERPAGSIESVDFEDLDFSDPLRQWRDEGRERFCRDVRAYRARRSLVNPERVSMPCGYSILALLEGAALAQLTAQFLALLDLKTFPLSVTYHHTTYYSPVPVPHPLHGILIDSGAVQIGAGLLRLDSIFRRRSEPVLKRISTISALLPSIAKLEDMRPSWKQPKDDPAAFWIPLADELARTLPPEDDAWIDLWTGAAGEGVVPRVVRMAGQDVPVSEIDVTTSPDLANRARSLGRAVVVLDDRAMDLWLQAGSRDLRTVLEAAWDSLSGPVSVVQWSFPELGPVLRQGEPASLLRCQAVEGLRLAIEGEIERVPCLMSDSTLLFDPRQLAILPRAERMVRLLHEIGAAGWLESPPAEALRKIFDAGLEERRDHVASGATVAERLARAVGGRREPLIEALGESLGALPEVTNCSLSKLAELVLAHLGPATLSRLSETLAAEDLKPPGRWNGAEARSFVAQLGFPPVFAASAEAKREPEELVTGPVELPPLHDFQGEVLDGIATLISSDALRRRAVVSLPTGGGKTRVTVEAAVRLVLAPGGDHRSVLWIAQTDEICEQAVQAFREVWVNLGAQRTDLRIVRLWGGSLNPAPQSGSRPIVVVASIQTLNSRIDSPALAWFREPGLVVVDECHHGIAPSYTAVFRWLDALAPKTGSAARQEPPILGLSATPFRVDGDESRRLASRFDNLWLPGDQRELHGRLLERCVLSRADYESLKSEVTLTEDEERELEMLPDDFEGPELERFLARWNERLAGNAERNEALLGCVRRSEQRSILLFANSVSHAEEISARLNLSGIEAAAISGETPRVARRYFLDRFRAGSIRVLCNYQVLATGFDAPKTDMVLIARQVFSPVRYMQMVGRGLRGEANGGTATCRIVTVLDNLGRFQERHAFHYCERHYRGLASRPKSLGESSGLRDAAR